MGKYNHSDLLYCICKSQMKKDFDVADVKRVLVETKFFSSEEYEEIEQIKDEEEQVDKLVFMLVYKQKNINKFFEVISEEYGWICNEWIRVTNENHTNSMIDQAHECIKNSEIPKNRDTLVHRLKYLWETQRQLKKLRRGEYVILTGKTNHGKKWIASDAVTNFEIVVHMNFKIFWLNLQKCTTQDTILEKLNKLILMIDTMPPPSTVSPYENNTKNKIFHAKKFLKQCFENEKFQDSLLVLSGVQTIEVLKAFELNCKILLTTRFPEINKSIPNDLKYVISVDEGFTESEAECFFLKFLNKPKLDCTEQNYIWKFNELCGGMPYIMNLVASNLTEFSNNRIISIEKLKHWITTLKTHDYDYNFKSIIEESLNHLSDNHRRHYEKLVIFRDNVSVPIKVLTEYWKMKNVIETQDLLSTFKKSALVEVEYEGDSIVCHLQYVYYNYLKNILTEKFIQSLHKEFVNGYRIQQMLNNRNLLEFMSIFDDNYFYRHIGYHLKEAEMPELFSKLYLDFGFLEQKLRKTLLPNTMNDLHIYKTYFINNSLLNEKIYDDLIEFLPFTEEMMFKSKDARLLQYALNYKGELQKEAEIQACSFQNHVWLKDIDHIDKQREIVHLPDQPNLIYMFEPEIALIALSDFSIILKDFTKTHSTIFLGHKSKIIQILALDYDNFVSLDESGIVKLWAVANTRGLGCGNQEFDEVEACYRSNAKDKIRYCTQEIHFIDEKILSIYPDQYDGKYFVKLLVQKKTKTVYPIKIYEYVVQSEFPLIPTQIHNIQTKSHHVIGYTKILTNYDILISQTGEVSVFYDIDSGNVVLSQQLQILPDQLLVDFHRYNITTSQNSEKIIFVFENKICIGEFKRTQIIKQLNLNFQELNTQNECCDDVEKILCSKITTDKRYLLLGTKQGCVIYDHNADLEIFRIFVSESIISLDVVGQEDVYIEGLWNYTIVTCIDKPENVIYICGGTINTNSTNFDEFCLNKEQYVNSEWLMGGRLYDAVYDHQEDEFCLHGVSSKKTIHRKHSSDEFCSSTTVDIKSKITSISSCKSNTIVGCQNGEVYSLNFKMEATFLKGFSSAVIFIKCLTDDLTLIGTNESCHLLQNESWKDVNYVTSPIFDAILLYQRFIVIILNIGEVHIYNIDDCVIMDTVILNNNPVTAVDLNESVFYVATMDLILYEFIVSDQFCNEIIKAKHVQIFTENANIFATQVTCLSINSKRNMLAVGYNSGKIDIFEIPLGANMKLIVADLSSVNTPLREMKFSPWISTSDPEILVVISDQICFYDVSKKIIQNFKRFTPLTNSRRNSRFRVKQVNNVEPTTGLNMESTNLWINKRGSHDREELLSSIKFIGNSAHKLFYDRDFHKFLTIDNEGNIYYLRLIHGKPKNVIL